MQNMNFQKMVQTATGEHGAYKYQEKLATDGPVELLCVPTGAGKTLAAILPWLYRRRFHPDPEVRNSTPRRLVYALPMRTLVEQTSEKAQLWLENLKLNNPEKDNIGAYVLMGGESKKNDRWRLHPESDAIIIGTIDMLLSRALNRGFGESKWGWPISFGLLNNDCHWVLDEIQLLGPGLSTTRQLQAFRDKFKVVGNSSTMWMSATVDESTLDTVDSEPINPEQKLEYGNEEYQEEALEKCLDAPKQVEHLAEVEKDKKQYNKLLASQVSEIHQQGSLTLIFVNTIKTAKALYKEVQKLGIVEDEDLLLVHSRFREGDRKKILEKIKPYEGANSNPDGSLIVISTQVLEAGVDISAQNLITEVAVWPSIVQRMGRCNRYGKQSNSTIYWVCPFENVPYTEEEIEFSKDTLKKFTGKPITAKSIQLVNFADDRVFATLRRKDLLDLFDTSPDLIGNYIDVSPFIREADNRDCQVAWRQNIQDREAIPSVLRGERCSVSIGDLRDYLKQKAGKSRIGLFYDHISRCWTKINAYEIRPGMVVVLDANEGGYSKKIGWDATSKEKGENLDIYDELSESEKVSKLSEDQGTDDDTGSIGMKKWILLSDHLDNVHRWAKDLFDKVNVENLKPEQIEAATIAAALHDIGKAHPAFQEMLRLSIIEGNEATIEGYSEDPVSFWAKSSGYKKLTAKDRAESKELRSHFRHELASALALEASKFPKVSKHPESDLILYLVAAHHGRVRLGFRSMPDEESNQALGVQDGDTLPEQKTPFNTFPKTELNVTNMLTMGEGSWTDKTLPLRDNLGPFRLAFLEAIVRLADWKASAEEQGEEL